MKGFLRGLGRGRGERILASAESADGTVAGTLDALLLPVDGGTLRLPWVQIESVDWDRDSEVLRVLEVGSWGEPRREHRLDVAEPGLLLEFVRERVTASVLVQRHVAISEDRGVRVIGRREASGERRVHWLLAYDDGIDPEDPEVARVAAAALAAVKDDVGF